VITVSTGAFAETENDLIYPNTGAVYSSQRNAAGWTTTALEPPASRYSQAAFEGASADLSGTLWMLHEASKPEGVEELYRREPDGSLDRIGPGDAGSTAARTTPANVSIERITLLGASAGLTHVLFGVLTSSEHKVWPGDTTLVSGVFGPASLYEYSGAGNTEPTLVGVSNEGHLAGHTYVNEGAKLLSQCGTVLGGQEGESERTMYNAISESGGSIFFTAIGRRASQACREATAKLEACEAEEPRAACEERFGPPPLAPVSNEVYVRVDGSRTLDISEPPLNTPGRECTASCETDELLEASRSEGVFEGASRDGTKVFFRTTQPLLNADTDSTSDLYEVELEGSGIKRLVMVSKGGEGDATPGSGAEVLGVVRVSEDGSHVYFVARGQLTTGSNGEGQQAMAGKDNMYVFDTVTQTTRFVATLSGEDEDVWRQRGDNVDATPDGRFLVFASAADLTSDDTSGESAPQLFEYDAATGRLVRVSVGANGSFNNDGNTNVREDAPTLATGANYRTADQPTTAASSLRVTSDGSVVVFQSKNSLTPQALDGATNVYEYEAGNVHLISDGHDASLVEGGPAVRLWGMDASGQNVLFTTADSLVPEDTDTQLDVYDARREGGFPGTELPVSCSGEECQGALSQPPQLSAPASATAEGGNLAPPTPVPVKPKTAAQIRAQKLAKALKACHAKHNRHKRQACEAQARKRYGPTKAKKASHTTTTRKGGK
jgi:hypothetical protein